MRMTSCLQCFQKKTTKKPKKKTHRDKHDCDTRGGHTERWNGSGGKGPLEAIESNPPAVSRDIFNQTRLLRAPSNLAFIVSRDGAATTSLGNLGQGFTTLTVKNFFLISSLNLPSPSLKPLLPVLLKQASLERLTSSFLQAPSGTEMLL